MKKSIIICIPSTLIKKILLFNNNLNHICKCFMATITYQQRYDSEQDEQDGVPMTQHPPPEARQRLI